MSLKPDQPGNWQPISKVPTGFEGRIANYLRASEAAKRNGSKDLWVYGIGREAWKGHWTNILGATASYWDAPL